MYRIYDETNGRGPCQMKLSYYIAFQTFRQSKYSQRNHNILEYARINKVLCKTDENILQRQFNLHFEAFYLFAKSNVL